MMPCPFCGESDRVDMTNTTFSHSVYCQNCGACGPRAEKAACAAALWDARGKLEIEADSVKYYRDLRRAMSGAKA